MSQENTEPESSWMCPENIANRLSYLSEDIKAIISKLPLSPNTSLQSWNYDETKGIVTVELLHTPIIESINSINISLIREKDGSITASDDD